MEVVGFFYGGWFPRLRGSSVSSLFRSFTDLSTPWGEGRVTIVSPLPFPAWGPLAGMRTRGRERKGTSGGSQLSLGVALEGVEGFPRRDCKGALRRRAVLAVFCNGCPVVFGLGWAGEVNLAGRISRGFSSLCAAPPVAEAGLSSLASVRRRR